MIAIPENMRTEKGRDMEKELDRQMTSHSHSSSDMVCMGSAFVSTTFTSSVFAPVVLRVVPPASTEMHKDSLFKTTTPDYFD